MATRQRELTLLVVGRDDARLAGLRLEYTGETSCPASAEDLGLLLDRRSADAVVFLSHADLAAPLLDYLKRRGKSAPASVICLGNGLSESNPQLDAALRRLGEAADPCDLLARLFEALASADVGPQLRSLGAPAESAADLFVDMESREPEPADDTPAFSEQDARIRRLQVVLERRLSGSSEP